MDPPEQEKPSFGAAFLFSAARPEYPPFISALCLNNHLTNVDNPYANPAPTAARMSPAERKQWAILSHVVSIFFGAVSAAIFYFLCRDRGPYVRCSHFELIGYAAKCVSNPTLKALART